MSAINEHNPEFSALSEHISALKKKSAEEQLNYKPLFFRLDDPASNENFQLYLSQSIFLTDEIYDQLKELIKIKNPTRNLSDKDYEELITIHLNGREIFKYGVWIYYPWNRRMVHTLDEQEFIEVRTSRNQYKITIEERDLLASKKVGVIGLSVGQSVSVTMAMERSCGELRLADFDVLELTNYNRIRTGLHNLGLKKVVTVAREIAEIDPYLKVVCFPDGITEDNIDGFLTDNGRLDLLIDECDGVDVKVLCRQKAKALQIPVVMEASDRATVDVERFDLEPDRPILHGFIDHLDISKLKGLRTNEEKVPYILPIAGIETLSKRMKASMVEVGQTITTWPQLASAVAFGGGIVTDVCRRIFLDEYHESGRYFIDIDELIGDKNKKEKADNFHPPVLEETQMLALISQYKPTLQPGLSLTEDVLNELVGAAILAPSGGNAQPWKWHWASGILYLFRDTAMETRLVDYNSTASYIALGAASENLVLKAHESGYEVAIDKFPLGEHGLLVAAFVFYKKDTATDMAEPHVVDGLVNSIPLRSANRTLKITGAVPADKLEALQETALTIPGAKLTLLTEAGALQAAAGIIGKADRIRIMHEGGHKDFIEEMVWTEEEARSRGRGIEIDSLDLNATERAGLRVASDWSAIEYLNKWNKGAALERASRKSGNAAAAIGLITVSGYDMQRFYNGGRAVERVWLQATDLGVGFQPLSISTFLFNRLLHEGEQAFSQNTAQELYGIRKEFVNLFHLSGEDSEILLFRLFMTDIKPRQSFRVPMARILSIS